VSTERAAIIQDSILNANMAGVLRAPEAIGRLAHAAGYAVRRESFGVPNEQENESVLEG